jgi:NADPH:quinone reductase-like Zn-dependent oxidoreductase
MTTMHAARAHARGGAEQLRFEDVPKPEPRAGEALIRVHAAGITPTELEWSETWVDRQGHDRTPTIPSHEVSGVVEELGHGVTHVVAGEEVFGLVPFDHDGAAAEYVAVRARDLAPKPVTLDHSRTAALPLSALTAWQAFAEQAHVHPGNHVLVHGGAGGVGAFAVQIAKALGAHVTGVASTRNLDLVRSLGADEVIDYTKDDFTRSGRKYDFILDNVSNYSLTALRRALTPTGMLVPNGGNFGNRWLASGGRIVRGIVLFRFGDQSLGNFLVSMNHDDLVVLKDMIEAGKVTPVMDRTYGLADVAAAIAQVGSGHLRGKVTVSMAALPVEATRVADAPIVSPSA